MTKKNERWATRSGPAKPIPFGRGDAVVDRKTGTEMRVLHVTRYGDGIGPLFQCKWGTRTHWTSKAFGPEELRAAQG